MGSMKSSAFTLIELVMVVSIVALLTALAVPVLRSVQRQAIATACRANIKNLYISLRSYDTSNGTLPHGFRSTLEPPPGGHPGNPAFDALGWYWLNYIRTTPESLQCPAKNLQDYWLQRDILCGNYGVNRALCRSSLDNRKYREAFGDPPLSIDNLRQAGNTLLLVDSGYAVICWWQARDEPLMQYDGGTLEDTAYIPAMEINRNRTLAPGQDEDARLGRHPNERANVGYADGHVRAEKADDLLVEKTGEGTYTNRTPLWESK